MSKRYELTDEQWPPVEPILPRRTATTGHKPKDPRQMLNGIVRVLRSGAPCGTCPNGTAAGRPCAITIAIGGTTAPSTVFSRPRKRPKRLAGDKGYSYPRIRRWLGGHGIKAVISRRSNERPGRGPFDIQSYRRRSVIEQCVGWLKECRRIGTRSEKLAVSFVAMFTLAMIQRYLNLLFSDRA
jgi:transposase